MKTSKIIIILAFGLILMACKNETLELKNKVPLCSITSPENNSLFAINEDITINILANDSDGFIENVKLLVDSVEYGVTKISPYKFIVKNNELTLGQHSLIAVATDNKGATKNDTVVITQNPDYNKYSGDFTFKTRSFYWVLQTYKSDTTIYHTGRIETDKNGIVTLYYKENTNVTFHVKENGIFISEGDFYYNGGKEGEFIGIDSVSFHIQGPGVRSSSSSWVTGKRR